MRVKFIHKIPDLSILFFSKTAKIYFGRFGIFGYILIIRKRYFDNKIISNSDK